MTVNQPVNATPPRLVESKALHDLKNQLGIILGFSELLLADMTTDDPRRPDVTEIRTATLNAMQLVPD
jgi:signal transduction histidine kinase